MTMVVMMTVMSHGCCFYAYCHCHYQYYVAILLLLLLIAIFLMINMTVSIVTGSLEPDARRTEKP